MIRQLNPPTIFVIFSAAERRWQELIDCLSKLLNLEEGKEYISEYERKLFWTDPITCTRYYIHRFQALQKLLNMRKQFLAKYLTIFL